MFVSLGIPQTYKAIATSHLSQRYINLHLWRRNIYNHSSRVHYFPHCTVTTERHHVERGATSRQEEHKSPTEKNIESFLAEKGYKVEDSVILFDGECNLCNGSVNFVLDHDKEGIFKFAALQSPVGIALLQKYNGPMDLSSLVLIEKGRLLLHSEAVLRIAELLDNQVIRVLAVATRWGFPRWLRDWVYTEIISKYRRQIFGETDSCRLMEPGWEHRFL